MSVSRDVAEGVDADVEFFGSVAGATPGFAIEVDERAEAVRFAADDGDHQGKTQGSGAGEGLRCAAYAEPDGKGSLQGAREDTLTGERGPVLAGPVNVCLVAELQEEVELFGEEGVVVLEVEAEEGEGLDEGAPADDDLGAAAGDQVECCELLEDADGVGGAEYCDGAGEADASGCARRRRRG